MTGEELRPDDAKSSFRFKVKRGLNTDGFTNASVWAIVTLRLVAWIWAARLRVENEPKPLPVEHLGFIV